MTQAGPLGVWRAYELEPGFEAAQFGNRVKPGSRPHGNRFNELGHEEREAAFLNRLLHLPPEKGKSNRFYLSFELREK